MGENFVCDADILEKSGALFRRIWQVYQEYLAPEGSQVSPHQMYLLKLLERESTLTPSEIAGQFGITLGAATGFIDRVYKLGLITRTRSEVDRRLVLIQLTPEGLSQLQAFEQQQKQKHRDIINKIGLPEIIAMNQSLEKFLKVLEELGGRE
jgi:DNA-binding MarR family transcriptional regulator